MQSKVLEKCGNAIEHFIIAIFGLATAYLLVRGSFNWDGGCEAYARVNKGVAGLCMLVLAVCVLFFVFRFYSYVKTQSSKRQKKLSVILTIVAVILQILFVKNVQVLIRYDSLKVVDEALGIFSQGGILQHDLDGYFARYSNNYAVTIMTHWILKLFHKFGVIAPDYSDAVLKLQYVNIFFVDAALAGVYTFLERFFSRAKAVTFLGFMLLNPMTYVWLPFYYTNTISMGFMIWGFLGLLYGLIYYEHCTSTEDAEEYKIHFRHMMFCYIFSAGMFYVGFKLRATVMIGLIAMLLVMLIVVIEKCRIRLNRSNITGNLVGFRIGRKGIIKKEKLVSPDDLVIKENEDKDGHNLLLCKQKTSLTILSVATFLVVFLIASFAYGKVEKHYVHFDQTDTQFPVTHWVAMGLSYYGDGSFTPADEEYTISFPTAAEKKEATRALIKERAKALGASGVAKLYLKKLHNTFSDGTGAFYAELGMSENYSTLWEYVYGSHRDFVLMWTQVFYLASLMAGVLVGFLLIKKQTSIVALWMPLTLLGHYMFQMIWESGTVYSIGTLFISGCMVALSCKFFEQNEEIVELGKKKLTNIICIATTLILVVGSIAYMSLMDREYIDVSVNQFLFQAVSYPALTEDREIIQTFETDRSFSNIGIEVYNEIEGANDSVYQVALFDGAGNLLEINELIAKKVSQYGFYQMEFHNVEGVTNYQIRIRKEYGQHDLAFLYYDTGHYDVYSKGKMSGTVLGDMADLTFVVFDRSTD